MQKILLTVQLDPIDWYDRMFRFYDYFYQRRFSISDISRLLRVTNLWGYFLSRKLGQTYLKIPMPSGKERERILQAYFQKKGRHVCESDPITPEQLEKIKPEINELNYNWLYLSVWLGLRPSEIDQLKDPLLYQIKKTGENTAVLWVYQTKLISVDPRNRWKLIPIIFPGQSDAMRIIEQTKFKRPLNKTIRHYFGEHTTLYGGRKGFSDLMLRHQQPLENISQWMGHSTIDRTWRNHNSRTVTHLPSFHTSIAD